MKKILIGLTMLLLFVVNPLVYAQEGTAGENPLSEVTLDIRTGADPSVTVKASAAIPSAEEQRIMEELKAARIAGDRETAGILQASLERMHGVKSSHSFSSGLTPPAIHTFRGTGSASGTLAWGGDVLITDPAIGMIKPGMVSDPNGVLYAAVDVLSENVVRIYRSLDGGLNWAYIQGISGGDDIRNPSVAFGEDGAGDNALYVAMEMYSGGLHGVLVMHMDVNTLTSYSTYVEWGFSLPGSEQVYPRICTDYLFFTGYYVYVTYSVHAIDYYPVMFSRSFDLGVSYETPSNITGGAENSQWQTMPDIDFGTSGLFVAYEKLGWTGSNWEVEPWVLESNNYGSSFSSNTQLANSTSPGFHPAVAAAPDNSCIVVAYTKDWGTDTDCYYAYSTDGGSNWTTENALPWSYDNEKAADLCASHSYGKFHAAYYKDTNSVRYTNTDCNSPSSWVIGFDVNDVQFASSTYPRPSVCVDPTVPVDDEGCVAWTDFRGAQYGAYFDRAIIPPLTSNSVLLSASSGGSITFYLKAGSANGGRNYLLLGSLSGTVPGTPLPGGYAVLPINWDAFTDMVFSYLNSPLFVNFLGVLNGSGQAQAQLNSPPLSGIYVGLVMDYAFCCNNLFDFASNPRSIEIVP